MDDSELEALLKEPESDRVERKSSLADRDRICQAICAFANDLPNHRRPGVIFVGLTDDGVCTGLADHRRAPTHARRSTSERERLSISEYDCAKAGNSWLRNGRYRGEAFGLPSCALSRPNLRPYWTEASERYTRRGTAAGGKASNVRCCFRCANLPSAIHPDLLSGNARSVEHQLSALRFTTIEGVPTVNGVLVIGKNPTHYIPGAFVQFLRLDGSSLASDIKDEKELSGCLIDLLRHIDEILKINISTPIDARALMQVDRPDYPLPALQQIVRNAMMHRTYEATNAPVRLYWFDDRVEVHSPGGPFGLVTRNNFGQPGISDYRNPTLAEAMKALGYVQRFGVGIAIARQEMQ